MYLSRYITVLLCIVTFFISKVGNAQQAIIYSDPTEKMLIGKFLQIHEDKTNNLTIDEIINSDEFQNTIQEVPNLSISSSTFWIKFKVRNETNEDRLLLEFMDPLVDNLEFYSNDKNGKLTVKKAGDNFKFSERLYAHPNFVFNMNIPQDEERIFYLKISGRDQLLLPISIGTEKLISESFLAKDIIFGIYVGVFLVMIFYNLFIFFTVSDISYLFYVLYILFIGLTQSTIQGYTFKYLWPEFPEFGNYSLNILSSLSGVFAIEFLKVFLRTKENTPKLHTTLYFISGSYLFAIVFCFLGIHYYSNKLIDISAVVGTFLVIYIAFIIARKGYRPAVYFLVAWALFLSGIMVFAFRNFGLLPFSNFTNYTMQAGSALEVILLSFALADRINILKKEKENSQREAFEALQENDRLLKAQNVILDQKVKERTEELQKTNNNLGKALQELKEAQAQLVNAEKMASLGQLTAGVAHEINNPINFVSSSIKPLKRDVNDLISVLDEYKKLEPSNYEQKMKEINHLIQELDIDYVKEEIESLLKGIEDGASRTSQIVMGLKTFSRIDETDLKKVDLNEGLESTLVILNSELRDRVKVEKEYGEIPKVECYAGKINQVFMNIINNAVFAVNKKQANNEGKISIKTKVDNTSVIISIKDNGIGIPAHVKSKIFDPFFTTKDVGEGTGLGLSIVYNIIETHKGNIKVESEEGVGTEFIITLPVEQLSF